MALCKSGTKVVRISYEIRHQSASLNVVVMNFVRISHEVRTICTNLYHFGAEQTRSAHSTQHSNTKRTQKDNTLRRSYGLPAHSSTTRQNIKHTAQCKEPCVSILHTQLHVHKEDTQNGALREELRTKTRNDHNKATNFSSSTETCKFSN